MSQALPGGTSCQWEEAHPLDRWRRCPSTSRPGRIRPWSRGRWSTRERMHLPGRLLSCPSTSLRRRIRPGPQHDRQCSTVGIRRLGRKERCHRRPRHCRIHLAPLPGKSFRRQPHVEDKPRTNRSRRRPCRRSLPKSHRRSLRRLESRRWDTSPNFRRMTLTSRRDRHSADRPDPGFRGIAKHTPGSRWRSSQCLPRRMSRSESMPRRRRSPPHRFDPSRCRNRPRTSSQSTRQGRQDMWLSFLCSARRRRRRRRHHDIRWRRYEGRRQGSLRRFRSTLPPRHSRLRRRDM